MSKKSDLIQNNPELFRKFKKAVARATWLMASVNLCPNDIGLYPFKIDETGFEQVTRWHDYSEETLNALNGMLDARAAKLKEAWLPEYKKLYDSRSEGWAFDLTETDCAILEIGEEFTDFQRYRLAWSFEGLREAAEYISERMNCSFGEEDG